jgi:fructose-1,6-bisphosphatase
MRDKIIERVVNKIKSRSDVGYKKYGVTLEDDEQTLDTWLNHLQEELMDAVNYIEKARSILREEIEECYIRDAQEQIADGINNLDVYEEKIL